MKENTALVAISQLTLSFNLPSGVDLFHRRGSSAPSTATMTECLVTAAPQRACVRRDRQAALEDFLFVYWICAFLLFYFMLKNTVYFKFNKIAQTIVDTDKLVQCFYI